MNLDFEFIGQMAVVGWGLFIEGFLLFWWSHSYGNFNRIEQVFMNLLHIVRPLYWVPMGLITLMSMSVDVRIIGYIVMVWSVVAPGVFWIRNSQVVKKKPPEPENTTEPGGEV